MRLKGLLKQKKSLIDFCVPRCHSNSIFRLFIHHPSENERKMFVTSLPLYTRSVCTIRVCVCVCVSIQLCLCCGRYSHVETPIICMFSQMDEKLFFGGGGKLCNFYLILDWFCDACWIFFTLIVVIGLTLFFFCHKTLFVTQKWGSTNNIHESALLQCTFFSSLLVYFRYLLIIKPIFVTLPLLTPPCDPFEYFFLFLFTALTFPGYPVKNFPEIP